MPRSPSPAATMLIVAVSCSSPPGGEAPVSADLSPDSIVTIVEHRLLTTGEWAMAFTVQAEGAFQAALTGRASLRPGNQVHLDATGTFGTDSVDLRLVSDGAMVSYGNRAFADAPTPDSLRGALVIGLTRMGILHNLARLVGNAPPDHADGGVSGWVERRNHRLHAGDSEGIGVTFDIVVAGVESGSATMHVDPATARPISRAQRVQFPDGVMEVREEYRWEES